MPELPQEVNTASSSGLVLLLVEYYANCRRVGLPVRWTHTTDSQLLPSIGTALALHFSAADAKLTFPLNDKKALNRTRTVASYYESINAKLVWWSVQYCVLVRYKANEFVVQQSTGSQDQVVLL